MALARVASAAVLLAMEATAPAEEELEVVKETQAALMAVAGAIAVAGAGAAMSADGAAAMPAAG